jgi:hypothetical protein
MKCRTRGCINRLVVSDSPLTRHHVGRQIRTTRLRACRGMTSLLRGLTGDLSTPMIRMSSIMGQLWYLTYSFGKRGVRIECQTFVSFSETRMKSWPRYHPDLTMSVVILIPLLIHRVKLQLLMRTWYRRLKHDQYCLQSRQFLISSLYASCYWSCFTHSWSTAEFQSTNRFYDSFVLWQHDQNAQTTVSRTSTREEA